MQQRVVQIVLPEQVALSFPLAGLGNRAIAQLIDLGILALWCLLEGTALILWEVFNWFGSVTSYVLGAAILLLFFVIWGYFIVFEYFFAGQTVGKRLMRIRVIHYDGRHIPFFAAAVRNFLRLIDFMPSGYLFGLVSLLLSPHQQRLGDLAAGTLVVSADARHAVLPLRMDRGPKDKGHHPDNDLMIVSQRRLDVSLVLTEGLSPQWRQFLAMYRQRVRAVPKRRRHQLTHDVWSKLGSQPGVWVVKRDAVDSGRVVDAKNWEPLSDVPIDSVGQAGLLRALARALKKQDRQWQKEGRRK